MILDFESSTTYTLEFGGSRFHAVPKPLMQLALVGVASMKIDDEIANPDCRWAVARCSDGRSMFTAINPGDALPVGVQLFDTFVDALAWWAGIDIPEDLQS